MKSYKGRLTSQEFDGIIKERVGGIGFKEFMDWNFENLQREIEEQRVASSISVIEKKTTSVFDILQPKVLVIECKGTKIPFVLQE